MTDLDLKTLEEAIKLVQKYQLESLELSDGTKIIKKIHIGKPLSKPKKTNRPVNEISEEVMFLSSPAPKLKSEAFNRFGMPHMIDLQAMKDKE